ncbi:hypothetical protein MY3296_009934 [Beauveria thailandica]
MAYWTPDSGSLSPDNVMSMYQESRLMSHPRYIATFALFITFSQSLEASLPYLRSIKISPILASEGVMKYLWKRSQRVETTVDSLRQIASAGNYDYVVEHIRGGGSNFNNTDKYGRTILHWAVIEGKLELVTSLLERQDIEIGTTDFQENQRYTMRLFARTRKWCSSF